MTAACPKPCGELSPPRACRRIADGMIEAGAADALADLVDRQMNGGASGAQRPGAGFVRS
ncbi:MAG: hypothetical protein ACLP7P_19415 [Rhodomicrobium sp.]